MIPHFHWTVIHLGSVPIQVWGLMVALGFIAGAVAAAWMARKRGLESRHVYDLAGWILIASMIGGRLFHVFIYEPGYYFAHPAEIIMLWKGGASIYGGFIGAVIASIIYLKKHRLDIRRYADTLMFGLPLGIFIGRLGCFFIHDHPGTATHFFLGVKDQQGIAHHDLGLYESLLGLGIFLVFLVMNKLKIKEGSYLPVFCLLYGLCRFFLDFLRVADTIYFGLTPAQYLSICLVLVGLVLSRRRKEFRGK